MKKSLLAVAAIGAFASAAQAQSSVTVYGNLDVSLTSVTNSNYVVGGTETRYNIRTTGNGDGAMSTSILGFRGTEDLGKGLKANFQLEYDLVDLGTGGNGNSNQTTTNGAADTTTGYNGTGTGVNNGFGARYSWLGLQSNSFGELRLGRQESAIHNVVARVGSAGQGNNMTGAMYSQGSSGASQNNAAVRPHGVFINRAVTYMTPVMSGFQLQVQTGSQSVSSDNTATTAANTSASDSGASLTFTGVKNLTVAYGIQKLDYNVTATTNTTADTKTQSQSLSANYDFGIVKAFAMAAERKLSFANGAVSAKDNIYEIGLRAPLTPAITAFASGYSGDRKSDTATSRADLSGYQIGLQYAFSKRTSAYGIYGVQTIKNTEAGATVTQANKIESSGMALGVRHSF